jgi:hypothetical protein
MDGFNPVPKSKHNKQGRAKRNPLPKVEKKCYITGATEGLHKHHIFGGANRKLSEQYGLYVYLIPKYHNMSDEGVHFNREFDLQLKREGQRKFESLYGSREDFRRIFGKNYLEG